MQLICAVMDYVLPMWTSAACTNTPEAESAAILALLPMHLGHW